MLKFDENQFKIFPYQLCVMYVHFIEKFYAADFEIHSIQLNGVADEFLKRKKMISKRFQRNTFNGAQLFSRAHAFFADDFLTIALHNENN